MVPPKSLVTASVPRLINLISWVRKKFPIINYGIESLSLFRLGHWRTGYRQKEGLQIPFLIWTNLTVCEDFNLLSSVGASMHHASTHQYSVSVHFFSNPTSEKQFLHGVVGLILELTYSTIRLFPNIWKCFQSIYICTGESWRIWNTKVLTKKSLTHRAFSKHFLAKMNVEIWPGTQFP